MHQYLIERLFLGVRTFYSNDSGGSLVTGERRVRCVAERPASPASVLGPARAVRTIADLQILAQLRYFTKGVADHVPADCLKPFPASWKNVDAQRLLGPDRAS